MKPGKRDLTALLVSLGLVGAGFLTDYATREKPVHSTKIRYDPLNTPKKTRPKYTPQIRSEPGECPSLRMLIVGSSSSTKGGNPYISRLEEECDLDLTTRAKNGAQTGWKLSELEKELASRPQGYYDAIAFGGGVNDLASGRTPESILKNIKEAKALIHKHGAKYIAVTMQPFNGYSSWKEKFLPQIQSINEIYKKEGDCVLDLYEASDPDNDGRINPEYTGDKLHLSTKKGQERIYERYKRCLQKIGIERLLRK